MLTIVSYFDPVGEVLRYMLMILAKTTTKLERWKRPDGRPNGEDVAAEVCLHAS